MATTSALNFWMSRVVMARPRPLSVQRQRVIVRRRRGMHFEAPVTTTTGLDAMLDGEEIICRSRWMGVRGRE